MSKKKASVTRTTSKTAKAKAAAAANPVTPKDVVAPPKAPASGSVAPAAAAASKAGQPARPPFRRPQTFNFAGVGRNDICPCGSGKRFKNCHGS